MDARTLTPMLSVAPQITVEDVAAAHAAGFRSIMCNRPDNEDPGQPDFATIAAAAAALNMPVRHVPIVTAMLTEDDLADFARALEELPGPMLAYCRSGTRSANVYAMVTAKE